MRKRLRTFWMAAIPLLILAALVVADSVAPDGGGDASANAPRLAAGARDESPAERPIATLRDLNGAFVAIAEMVNPAVVTVFTEKVLRVRQTPWPFFWDPFGDFFGDSAPDRRRQQAPEREFRQQGLGSGVVVSSDGYIITNNHVIANADTINVRFLDGKTRSAKVVGTDAKTDIAILKVAAKNLPTVPIGDSDDLRVGEWVLAIGSPLSPNLAHSVTSGIVSAKGRSNVGLADYEDFIQTDAAINPGNSGGALVNIDGELVGINTAIASRSGGYQGVGFAVPSNMAKRVMEALIEHGKVVRGWMGAYIQDIDDALAAGLKLDRKDGVLIADVSEGGPSEKAGLERGDVVLTIDGKPATSSSHLRNEIAARAPGTKVKLGILRGDKRKDVTIRLDELPSDEVAADVGQKLEEQLGFGVAPLDDDLAGRYGIRRDRAGVVITSVVPGGHGERAGLREGDLIVEIDRRSTKNLEEFNERIRHLAKGDTILFRIVRENRSFYIAFKV